MDGTRNLNHVPRAFIYSGPLMPRYISKKENYSFNILPTPFITGFVYVINTILKIH
jgi:hypothetical protein